MVIDLGDFPLWTFDVEGDFSADSYFWSIVSNRAANEEYFLRGNRRIAIPAISMLGLGAMGVALIGLGVRTMRARSRR